MTVTDGFPPKSFDVSALGAFAISDKGSAQLEIAELAPGANATHTLTLVPKVAGVMSVGRAEVKYKWLAASEELEEEEEEGEEGAAARAPKQPEVEFGNSMSSSQGKVDILTPEVYERVTKKRAPVAMGVAAIAAFGLVGVPFFMMTASKKAHAA